MFYENDGFIIGYGAKVIAKALGAKGDDGNIQIGFTKPATGVTGERTWVRSYLRVVV